MGFSSSSDPEAPCGNGIAVSYIGGIAFPLVHTGPTGTQSTQVVYFNGYLPAMATDLELCTDTISSGTIALDGVTTDQGLCPAHAGCYSYTCDAEHEVNSITEIDPFTATCN